MNEHRSPENKEIEPTTAPGDEPGSLHKCPPTHTHTSYFLPSPQFSRGQDVENVSSVWKRLLSRLSTKKSLFIQDLIMFLPRLTTKRMLKETKSNPYNSGRFFSHAYLLRLVASLVHGFNGI